MALEGVVEAVGLVRRGQHLQPDERLQGGLVLGGGGGRGPGRHQPCRGSNRGAALSQQRSALLKGLVRRQAGGDAPCGTPESRNTSLTTYCFARGGSDLNTARQVKGLSYKRESLIAGSP